MKIDTMRRIDRLAGIPLCAFATALVRLRDLLRRRRARPVRRILFVELSEMGTTVLADPAMRKARRTSSAELYFVIFARNVGSLELMGSFPPDNIFTISDRSIFSIAYDTLAFLLWTRRNEIDTVVDLELFSRFTALLSGLCGADRRVGFHRFHQEGLYRGEMLTHRVAYNPHLHIAKNFIALIDALFAPAPQIPYSKTWIGDDQIAAKTATIIAPPSGAARAQLLARIRCLVRFDPAAHRLVLINPNASELLPQRRWMPDRFRQLIGRILRQRDDVFVLIAARSGQLIGQYLSCREYKRAHQRHPNIQRRPPPITARSARPRRRQAASSPTVPPQRRRRRETDLAIPGRTARHGRAGQPVAARRRSAPSAAHLDRRETGSMSRGDRAEPGAFRQVAATA